MILNFNKEKKERRKRIFVLIFLLLVLLLFVIDNIYGDQVILQEQEQKQKQKQQEYEYEYEQEHEREQEQENKYVNNNHDDFNDYDAWEIQEDNIDGNDNEIINKRKSRELFITLSSMISKVITPYASTSSSSKNNKYNNKINNNQYNNKNYVRGNQQPNNIISTRNKQENNNNGKSFQSTSFPSKTFSSSSTLSKNLEQHDNVVVPNNNKKKKKRYYAYPWYDMKKRLVLETDESILPKNVKIFSTKPTTYNILVKDLEKSSLFYRKLGFHTLYHIPYQIQLRTGNVSINLHEKHDDGQKKQQQQQYPNPAFMTRLTNNNNNNNNDDDNLINKSFYEFDEEIFDERNGLIIYDKHLHFEITPWVKSEMQMSISKLQIYYSYFNQAEKIKFNDFDNNEIELQHHSNSNKVSSSSDPMMMNPVLPLPVQKEENEEEQKKEEKKMPFINKYDDDIDISSYPYKTKIVSVLISLYQRAFNSMKQENTNFNKKKTKIYKKILNIIENYHGEITDIQQIHDLFELNSIVNPIFEDVIREILDAPIDDEFDLYDYYKWETVAIEATSTTPNKSKIINVFKDLYRNAYRSKKSTAAYKRNAFKKVLDVLDNKISQDEEITSVEQAKEIFQKYGIQNPISSLKKIDEILETGGFDFQKYYNRIDQREIEEEEEVQEKDNIDTSELLKIYGIGPVKAKQLQKEFEITTINELKSLAIEKPNILTKAQKKGLIYWSDFEKRIPREEIVEYEKKIASIAKKIDVDMKVIFTGSYRRQLKDCGDIDILVTHPRNGTTVFEKLIAELTKDNIIHDNFAFGSKKFMGVSKLSMPKKNLVSKLMGKADRVRDQSNIFRRMDILYTGPDQFPFALLYFTGSKEFNIEMRKYAMKLGYILSERGIEKIDKKACPMWFEFSYHLSKTFIETEEDIFDFLGLPFLKPEEREHFDKEYFNIKDNEIYKDMKIRNHLKQFNNNDPTSSLLDDYVYTDCSYFDLNDDQRVIPYVDAKGGHEHN